MMEASDSVPATSRVRPVVMWIVNKKSSVNKYHSKLVNTNEDQSE